MPPHADYGSSPDALDAAPLCEDKQSIVPYAETKEAISRPGSYYAITANGEGIIILMPELRLAVFYYYG